MVLQATPTIVGVCSFRFHVPLTNWIRVCFIRLSWCVQFVNYLVLTLKDLLRMILLISDWFTLLIKLIFWFYNFRACQISWKSLYAFSKDACCIYMLKLETRVFFQYPTWTLIWWHYIKILDEKIQSNGRRHKDLLYGKKWPKEWQCAFHVYRL